MIWQPIETAPRDIPILATDGRSRFITEFNDEDDEFNRVARYFGYKPRKYTHWMLLPEMPK